MPAYKAPALCIQVQCGREYGFDADLNKELRTADLTRIPDEELVFAPTNNLIGECKLSVFGRRSRTAVCKNSQHTGELLRDNMMLHSTERTDLSKRASVIWSHFGTGSQECFVVYIAKKSAAAGNGGDIIKEEAAC